MITGAEELQGEEIVPVLDGRKLFYLEDESILSSLGIPNAVINKLKEKLFDTQHFGRISVMYGGGNREKIVETTSGKKKKVFFQQKQEYHTDYEMTVEKGYIVRQKIPSIMPYTFHIPLTSAGSHLHIEEIEEPFHLEFGDMLVVRGDVSHAGGIYDTDTYRMHLYIDTDVFLEDGTFIYVVDH